MATYIGVIMDATGRVEDNVMKVAGTIARQTSTVGTTLEPLCSCNVH